MFGGRRNRGAGGGCIQGSLSRTDRGGLPFLTELQFAPSYPAGHIYPSEPFPFPCLVGNEVGRLEREGLFSPGRKGNKGANGTKTLRPQTHVNFERNELEEALTQRGMRGVAECCRKAPFIGSFAQLAPVYKQQLLGAPGTVQQGWWPRACCSHGSGG